MAGCGTNDREVGDRRRGPGGDVDDALVEGRRACQSLESLERAYYFDGESAHVGQLAARSSIT